VVFVARAARHKHHKYPLTTPIPKDPPNFWAGSLGINKVNLPRKIDLIMLAFDKLLFHTYNNMG
jgi:hypothetical protein